MNKKFQLLKKIKYIKLREFHTKKKLKLKNCFLTNPIKPFEWESEVKTNIPIKQTKLEYDVYIIFNNPKWRHKLLFHLTFKTWKAIPDITIPAAEKTNEINIVINPGDLGEFGISSSIYFFF